MVSLRSVVYYDITAKETKPARFSLFKSTEYSNFRHFSHFIFLVIPLSILHLLFNSSFVHLTL